jgi:hypothetical protein
MALASALVAFVGLIPAEASAISRTDVLTRAQSWVKKRVGYSQRSYFAGYRRDCSGFVSMAWKTGRSYTSSSLRRIAKRIPISKLKPGDAVHTPGHVAIFVKWKNKARGTFVAMEQTTWGGTAERRVRKITRRSTGLRYRSISEPVRVASSDSTAAPTPVATPTVTLPGLTEPTVSTSWSTIPDLPVPITGGSFETTLTSFTTEFIALFELPSAEHSTVGAESLAGPTLRLAVVPLY